MDKKKTLYFLFSAAAMLVLILDGETALLGARDGLNLCIRSVIPSLFPFLFLSSILTGVLWGTGGRFFRPLCWLLGIPEGAHSILVSGFLGGYPTGAQAIGQAHCNGGLDAPTSVHLLRFCSNAGPAFLFGITAAAFPNRNTPWVLWSIHILSALMVGVLGKRENYPAGILSPLDRSPAEALAGAVKTMGILCGWVVCFRILLKFLDRWFLWALPEEIRILIWGLLELSNGCCALGDIPSLDLRFLICSAILAFGGVCVVLQTASVAESLPIGSYLQGKLLQTLFAVLLSFFYLRYGFISIILVSIFFLLPGILKKEVAFLNIPMYNTDITRMEVISCCFGKKSPVVAPTASMEQNWRMDRFSAQKKASAPGKTNASGFATTPANGFLSKCGLWI